MNLICETHCPAITAAVHLLVHNGGFGEMDPGILLQGSVIFYELYFFSHISTKVRAPPLILTYSRCQRLKSVSRRFFLVVSSFYFILFFQLPHPWMEFPLEVLGGKCEGSAVSPAGGSVVREFRASVRGSGCKISVLSSAQNLKTEATP